MSEVFTVREEFEVPAATPNQSQTSLQNSSKIEPEKFLQIEEILRYVVGNELGIAELAEEIFEVPVVEEKSLEVPLELEHTKEHEKTEEPEDPNDFELTQEISLLEDEELSSCLSFTSCCSYKYIRQSIDSRQIRDASTQSLYSFNEIDSLTDASNNQAKEKLGKETYSGEDLKTHSSSVKVVMEKRSIIFTPEGSDSDCEISLDEVFQRFSTWFNRTEIDSAFSSFMRVDEDQDGYICLAELKRFLEILEMPQTHLAVKNVMTHVVGNHEGRLNFCQVLLIHGTLMRRLELRKWNLQDREKQRLAMSQAVDVSQLGVRAAKLFFEAKIALQTEPLPLNLAQPVARIPTTNSQDCQNKGCQREQFKSAAAVFKKLESEQ
ncbi:EF-hand domain-containing protein D2 homolog [Drosophila elegans]|uniref:EF-hand domain-containing protein D2 homolog n=1 Tax=Drosophila elegans TaxID=30023 RepID=UPI0007E74AF7|nr:EF-hand domain-containing protein D2 homolog [Drosophila elegans]